MERAGQRPTDRVRDLVGELDLNEKAALTAGTDMWTTPALARLGIPAVRMTDGPAGARGTGTSDRSPSAAIPCGIALGATWDRELMVEVGEILGHQTRTKGARFLLAPTINLHRSPLGGRTFESFSEDPLLTGHLAAALIRGVQSRDVAATAKHYVGNEAETDRFVSNSVIDERTLRELYLVPFETAVKDGGVLAVMTAYNRVNGDWCSEHEELLSILRDDWGFEGLVMSDWYSVSSTTGSMVAGLDIEMPGPGRSYGAHVADAVRSGELEEGHVDAAVIRILSVFEGIGALDDEGPGVERSEDLSLHRDVIRQVAHASMVLLKNEGVLPFEPNSIKSLAVLGPNADQAQILGGGSATLEPHYLVSPLEALRSRIGADVEILHEPGCDTTITLPPIEIDLDQRFLDGSGEEVMRRQSSNTRLLYFGPPSPALGDRWSVRATGTFVPMHSGPHEVGLVQSGRARILFDGEVVVDGITNPPALSTRILGFGSEQIVGTVQLREGVPVEMAIELSNETAPVLVGALVGMRPVPAADLMDRALDVAARSDAVIVVVGTNDDWESEGYDRDTLRLPGDQDELVQRVCQVNPNSVVVLNAGSPLELPWADEAKAILDVWFGGQEMADGLVDILLGEADPGGRLPTTFPMRLEQTPAFGNFPGEQGEVRYGEGLLMGYRWYDTRRIPVRFPFGHGLSYTSFEIGPPSVTPGDPLTLSVNVTNIGERPGAEVVQIYVEPIDPPVERPRKELRSFEKVFLEPDESCSVTFSLDDRAFAYWQPDNSRYVAVKQREESMRISTAPSELMKHESGRWMAAPGKYLIHVARSVLDIAHSVEITL